MSFDRLLKDGIKQDRLHISPDKSIKDKLLQKFLTRSITSTVHRNSFLSNSLVLKAASIALILYMGISLNKLPSSLDKVTQYDSTFIKPLLADSVHRLQVVDSLVQ